MQHSPDMPHTRGRRYDISLRIWHPQMDPARITATLGLEPRVARSAGSPRPSDGGGAAYESSYWTAPLISDQSLDLARFIADQTRRLTAHVDFLGEIKRTGGRIEFFIGWFVDGNVGEVFESALLAQLGALGIDLAFDIYPPDVLKPGVWQPEVVGGPPGT
jgi:hypothetical protein